MMKKFFAVFLAVMMILTAGCGKEEKSATEPAQKEADVPTIVVGKTAEESENTESVENTAEGTTAEASVAGGAQKETASDSGSKGDADEEENIVSDGNSIDAHLFEGDFSGVVAEGMKNGINFSVENKSREMKDEAGDVYFTGEYQVPSVEIKDNAPAAAAINEYLTDSVASFETNMDLMAAEAASFIEVAKDDENYDPENDGAFSAAYEVMSSMGATRLDGAVISLCGGSYQFTGGAHGSHAYTGYNFDAKTGKLLTLSGIAENTDAFKASAKKYILTACRTMEGSEDLFPGYEESIDDMLTEGNWYCSNNGVIFIAQEYLLGPYAMGIMEFEVPYNMLDSMNPAYVR